MRILLILISLCASPVLAMEHYTSPLQDQNGSAISGASVYVYAAGTQTLATLYSDNGTTTKANPFTTGIDGIYDFYAASGVYDIVFVSPRSIISDEKTRRIALFDIHDGAFLPVTALPGDPTLGATVLYLVDSSVGTCDPAGGGTSLSVCMWDGSAWSAIAGGLAGWPSTRVSNISFANSLANSAGIGNGTDYWALYRDPTNGLQFNAVVGGTENATNYIRKLAATFYWEIRNASNTSIFRVTNDTGAITNATLDVEATGNTITITEEDWWDVAACQNATAQLIWNEPTANAPAAACDTGANTQKGYASFDATTDESFQTDWVLPTGFTGAIDIHFIWKAAATSGAVGWCAQLIRVADSSTSDPAYPAQAAGNCVSDTAKGTTLQENHATITGVTCTSCAARDHVYVRISRDANGGAVTDDMTGDAHLMKFGRTWRVAK